MLVLKPAGFELHKNNEVSNLLVQYRSYKEPGNETICFGNICASNMHSDDTCEGIGTRLYRA